MSATPFTILIDNSHLLAITAARLLYNKTLAQTVTDADGAEVPNPDLIATDAAYVQQRLGVDAPASWYAATQDAFRFPTGEWLQRWTTAEKKQIRAIGAGIVAGVSASDAATVQGFLDRLDASATVELFDPDVRNGVPFVCGLLETTGALAAGQGAVRAAEVNALSV